MSFFRRAGALIARFFTSTSDPSSVAGEFQLYSKEAGGQSQLFGRSDDGAIYQITPSLPSVAMLTAEAGVLPKLTAVRIVGDALVVAAQANIADNTDAIGLALQELVAGVPGPVAISGVVEATEAEWQLVTDGAGLEPGASYWLSGDTAGLLVLQPPVPPAYATFVGTALSLTSMRLGIAEPRGPVAMQRKLVAILGQSNAVGLGWTFFLDNGLGLTTPFPGVQMNQRLGPDATNPLVFVDIPTQALAPYSANPLEPGMGMELTAGRGIYAAGMRPVIIKIAVSATALAVHWLPTSTYPTLPPGGPNLFTQAIQYIRDREIEFDTKLGAILWSQGESDAADVTNALAYAANLQTFVSALRAEFGQVPFIFNKLSERTSDVRFPFRGVVRNQQEEYAELDPNAILVNTDDLPLEPDDVGDVHYTSDSFVAFGTRMAASAVNAIQSDAISEYPQYLGEEIGEHGTGELITRWGTGGGLPYEAGDFGILQVVTAAADVPIDLTTAAGFELITTGQSLNAGVFVKTAYYGCVATSGRMASPVVADTNGFLSSRIHVFRGVGAVESFNTLANNASNTDASTAAVVTKTNRSMIASFIGALSSARPNPITGIVNGTLFDLTLQANSTYSVAGEVLQIALITGKRALAGAVSSTTAVETAVATISTVTLVLRPVGNP